MEPVPGSPHGKMERRSNGQESRLYDLNKDIGEEKDVAAKNPSVAKRIKAIIDEIE